MLLPLLVADAIDKNCDDPADASSIDQSLIAPREVKIGDAKLFIFGDFIGKQTLPKKDEEEAPSNEKPKSDKSASPVKEAGEIESDQGNKDNELTLC